MNAWKPISLVVVVVSLVVVAVSLVVLLWAWPMPAEWVELDRATVGTVYIRTADVSAILGPGELELDDDGGVRHNAHTQIVTGGLRINVRGTAAQVHEAVIGGSGRLASLSADDQFVFCDGPCGPIETRYVTVEDFMAWIGSDSE